MFVCGLLLPRSAICSLTVPCRGCRVRPQASFSIFVLFVSYVLHANYSPFLPRVTMQSLQEISAVEPDAKTLAAGGKNRRAKVAPALVVKTADFVRAGPAFVCGRVLRAGSVAVVLANTPSLCGCRLRRCSTTTRSRARS